MRVLVACEYSGTVRDAFLARGHDAWSCDLLPTDVPGPHFQEDVLRVLERESWDLMIAHPPCTYLCSSGLHWNKRTAGRQELTEQALDFVRKLLDAPVPRIALENPVGCISTRIRKYDQKLQPWQYGEDASKGTCLWLMGLSPLTPTSIIPPAGWEVVRFASDMPKCECCHEEAFCEIHQDHFADCPCISPTEDEVTYKRIEGTLFGTRSVPPPRPVWANQTPSGQNKLGPSADRWKLRSATYAGIAAAFASQWG